PFGVVGHGLPGAVEDVRRVVAHQVAEPVVVLAPVPAVELEELVQPGAGLVAVAHAELEHVQLLGQRAAGVELVPDPEQLQDELPRGLDVPRVALAAGQGLLVLPAGGHLPVRQRLPVELVEPPDAAVPAGHPRLQGQPRLPVRQRLLDVRGEVLRVNVRASAQVEGDLHLGVRGVRRVRDRPADHGLAEVLLVLDPVADHARPAQIPALSRMPGTACSFPATSRWTPATPSIALSWWIVSAASRAPSAAVWSAGTARSLRYTSSGTYTPGTLSRM